VRNATQTMASSLSSFAKTSSDYHLHHSSMPHLMWTTGLLAVLALVSAVPRLQDVVPRGLAPGFDSNAVTLSPANQPNMVGVQRFAFSPS
jgi:hypothetical protein